MSSPKYPKHPELYIATVAFLVENCLFRVPRKPLEEESAVFRDMFLLPQPVNEMTEGQDDARPVVLHGVSKDDFECLLKALLCRQHGQNKGLVLGLTGQWISVLKLSTMWEFTNLRTAAISWLDTGNAALDHVEKIVLAMQYDLKEWLLSSLLALAQRPDPISIEEGRRLGIETALKLASVREKLKLERMRNGRWDSSKLVVGDRDVAAAQLDFTPMIQKVFELQPVPSTSVPEAIPYGAFSRRPLPSASVSDTMLFDTFSGYTYD
ncbi:hypothetical protein M404DRAFT_26410 [Pisolithus tinctorius Marx 270]|uniref:BTB domain-containing protein n=1 Tax=Pisolithus tinctorius Marx 270 TaxID=870435 RepID=A0A0C3K3S6_PISTI|nr:hypothetical protein M404DRAFT_26410 [Pisolithus tinctorius Marx 270]